MKDLPEYVHLQIIRYLQFSHMWDLSLVCKHFHALLNTRGVCDTLYEQRWNCKRPDTTMSEYLDKARRSTIRLTRAESRMTCNKWKLEKDENDLGPRNLSSSPSPSSNPLKSVRKIEYDDFDEEILPETDDFGEEISDQGTNPFEDSEVEKANSKRKREGLWVTFEANTIVMFRIEFLANFIDCESVVLIAVGPTGVRIMEKGYCVKAVQQEKNPKARLNTSGFQKYWASISEQTIRFGRGKLGEESVIEWKGTFATPTYVGVSTTEQLSLRYFETSGCNYLDYGLDDTRSEIAFVGEHIMEVHSSNWEFSSPSPVSPTSFTTVTVLLTTYSEYYNAFEINFELHSRSPVNVQVAPYQIYIYEKDKEAKHIKITRMQNRFGHYWITCSRAEACIGVGWQAGTSLIGKLPLGDDVSKDFLAGRVNLNCFRLNGPMFCKISNIRISWE